MLATSLCWWLYDGDRFEMLVTESLCWWFFSLCWWFFQCIKSVTNILNRSPTSQTCHQHIWSPTSVTNIDVTDRNYWNSFVICNRKWFVTFLKESLILEYFEQLKVKLQNAITSVNKTQFTFIDTRINAEIAKMLVLIIKFFKILKKLGFKISKQFSF